MNKKVRQLKILEIINTHNVETQEELCALLKESGCDATQATVSRDIRDMDLYKVPLKGGGFKYDTARGPVDSAKSVRVLKDSVLSLGEADRILVIKTSAGMAMAAAAAIDAMNIAGIEGTIAGDDTIMCAISAQGDFGALKDSLRELIF